MGLYNILVDIAANTASFESSMKRATDTLKAFGDVAKSALELGGVGLGLDGIKNAIGSALASGDQLKTLSDRMGTSVESLSRLQYAATTANIPFQLLTTSLDTFSKNIVQATEGSGKAQAAFHDLGIDVAKLAALPLDKQLDVIANKISSLPSATQQTAAAMRIFGAAGADLLPILQQGASGLEALRQHSDDLGVTMNALAIDHLAAANRAMTDFTASSHALWVELASDISPALVSFLNAVTKSLGEAKQMFDAVTGSGSAQSQIAGLSAQAKELQGRIENLAANSNWFNHTFNASQITAYTKKIADLHDKIANLTPLEPVTVTAQKSIDAGPDLVEVQVKAQKTLVDYMQQYYKSLDTMSQTDVEQTANAWQDKEYAAQQAYAEGVIDFTEYQNRIAALNDQFLQPVEVTAKYIANTGRTVYADMQKYALSAAQTIQADFTNFLEDPSITSFKNMGIEWLKTLDKMATDAAASQVFKMLFQGDNTPTGGLSGILGSALGSLFGMGGGGAMSVGASAAMDASASAGIDSAFGAMGFANGGSFDVGGAGGTDSQLVQFKATPGEHVQVGGGGASSPITIQNYVTVTSPQVSKADVLGAMQQTQASTVAKLQDMKRRGKF